MPSSFIHVVAKLNDTLLHLYAMSFSSIYLLMGRHLGCFYILAVTSNMNLENRYLFEIMILFPLDVYPEVELLDHTIDLSLIVLGTFNLCSIRAKPIYIPTRVYKHSLFSTFSQHFSLLGYRLSNTGEVISDCDFEIHFPDDY